MYKQYNFIMCKNIYSINYCKWHNPTHMMNNFWLCYMRHRFHINLLFCLILNLNSMIDRLSSFESHMWHNYHHILHRNLIHLLTRCNLLYISNILCRMCILCNFMNIRHNVQSHLIMKGSNLDCNLCIMKHLLIYMSCILQHMEGICLFFNAGWNFHRMS